MTIERFLPYHSEMAEYLSHLSDRYKYFYLANPKVASTAILRALQLAEADGDRARAPEHVHRRHESPIPTFANSQFSPEQILSGAAFFRFTYVRNPFTRALSAYLDKIVQDVAERDRLLPTLGLTPDAEVTFLDFLKAVHTQRDAGRDIHWMTQSRIVQCNNINYNFVGRFESFATTFPKILEKLGIDQSYLEPTAKHVTNAGAKLAQHLGDEERHLILTIYESDFVVFGYGRDPSVATL